MTASYTARATVASTSPDRYVKQLAAHLGHKAEIRSQPGGQRIVFAVGSCFLSTQVDSLELRAESDTAEGLDRVKEITESHLKRFGQRDGLQVRWLMAP
jgi:hypothetical protein